MKHKILALCCIAALLAFPAMAMAEDAPPGAEAVGTVDPVEGDGPTVTKWHWPDVSESDLRVNDENANLPAKLAEESEDPVRVRANQSTRMTVDVVDGDPADDVVGVCVVGADSPCNGDDAAGE